MISENGNVLVGSGPLRLMHFEVHGLFGEFTHKIPISKAGRITAIIAPNGSGKTICLRLISALFGKRWSFFSEVEFETVAFSFSSGQQLIIYKENRVPEIEEPQSHLGISFQLIGNQGEILASWKPGVTEPKTTTRFPLERYVHFLTRRSQNQYVHDYTGASYTYQEAVETYRESLPPSVYASLYADEPKIISELLAQIDCHLIETQRLLILKDQLEDYRNRGGPVSTLAISKKAELLRSVISGELTAYAALSQSLDRSFPKRVIEKQTIFATENLKVRLSDLDKKRQSLMQAGILDPEGDDPVSLPTGPLEPAIARVLSVYAEDTLLKLNSLSRLLARIELFKELINARFTKDVRLSKEKGFEVLFNGHNVPLEKLSSGEQHQLVLFFELLFELRENALILIDEPELSLHVAWQKKFISDLNRIIGLNQFDVIIATHSPQLISRWTSLVVELGKVDDDDRSEGLSK